MGPYDPQHMHSPNGVTIDGRGRLWVAETDHLPKRLSVWTLDGQLAQAFYGPPHYGGGGSIDPVDRTRFFYADSGGGMEFKLDWESGTSEPVAVYLRPELDPLKEFFRSDRTAAPETAMHVEGRMYLTDSYNTNPTNGTLTGNLWLMKDGVARCVATIGQAGDWPAFNPKRAKGAKNDATVAEATLKSRLPAGVNVDRDKVIFAWSDLNDDGMVQPEEVTCAKGEMMSVNFRADLSAITGSGLLFRPKGFTRGSAPIFDAAQSSVIVEGTQHPVSSGGGQAVLGSDGRFVFTNAPKPYSPFGIGGGKDGVATWSYPSMWPGLHASHIAPLPEMPGELIGTTRLLGLPVTPRGSDLGEIWGINGNKGTLYLFTMDGLFVATLFKDSRTGSWNMPRGAGHAGQRCQHARGEFLPEYLASERWGDLRAGGQ